MNKYTLDYSDPKALADRIIGLYEGKEIDKTPPVLRAETNEEDQLIDDFIALQGMLITMLNVFGLWESFLKNLTMNLDSIRKVFEDISEDNPYFMKETIGKLEFYLSLRINDPQAVNGYKEIVTFKCFIESLKEVYNLENGDLLIANLDRVIRQYQQYFKDVNKLANEYRPIIDILRSRAKQDKPLPIIETNIHLFFYPIEFKKPLYKKDRLKMIELVSDTRNFRKSYYNLVLEVKRRVNVQSILDIGK